MKRNKTRNKTRNKKPRHNLMGKELDKAFFIQNLLTRLDDLPASSDPKNMLKNGDDDFLIIFNPAIFPPLRQE